MEAAEAAKKFTQDSMTTEGPMYLSRRSVVAGLATTAAAGISGARAQEAYPASLVRIIVPFPAGGPSDFLTRFVAQKLGDLWKQSVIVENRAGASGAIGMTAAAQAKPDGYTLVLSTGNTNAALEVLNPKNTPYDTLRDFAPIGLMAVVPNLFVVRSDLAVRDVRDFIEQAKASPGKFTYASAATGSAPHFAFEMLKLETGADILRVPFNGAAPAMTALAGGFVDSTIGSPFSVAGVLQSGKARAIGAVAAGRLSEFPDLKTLGEQGLPNIEWDTWYGLMAPAAVPVSILDKINADLNQVLNGDEALDRLSKSGLGRQLSTREQLFEIVKNEFVKVRRVASAVKMTD